MKESSERSSTTARLETIYRNRFWHNVRVLMDSYEENGKRGISIAELARKTGTDAATLAAAMRNKSSIGFARAKVIADTLGGRLDEMTSFESDISVRLDAERFLKYADAETVGKIRQMLVANIRKIYEPVTRAKILKTFPDDELTTVMMTVEEKAILEDFIDRCFNGGKHHGTE